MTVLVETWTPREHVKEQTYQSPFTDFQTGLNMDAADDFIALAIAGGPVTPLV